VRAAALTRRRATALRCRGGDSPGKAQTVFQGVIRAAVWLGIIHTACVTHWWQQGGGSGLGRGSPRQGADLRGGARRRGHVRTVLGLNPSERGSVSGCGVNANPKPGSRKAGVLCGGSAMADPRRARRRDAGMGYLGSWGAPRPKISRARGWGGSQRCSPRLATGGDAERDGPRRGRAAAMGWSSRSGRCWLLQDPGMHGSSSGCAAKPSKGSERAEGHWWRENSTAARSHLT